MCRSCGFRFSESSTEFKETFHITGQHLKSFGSVEEFPRIGVARRNVAFEKFLDELSFRLVGILFG